MKNSIRALSFILAGMLLLFACQKPVTTSRASSDRYSEDLSGYRPSFEAADYFEDADSSTVSEELTLIEPTHQINQSLDSILDSIARADVVSNYFQGYTILLYSGNSREQAIMSRGRAMQMEEVVDEPEMIYSQPNYKVKIGQFYNRLEAQPLFTLLKKEFPNAIVAPERFYLKEE